MIVHNVMKLYNPLNMNINYTSCVVLLLLAFSHLSLKGQTASVTEGCAPLEVNFMAPAGSSSFFWDFQDNTSSNLQNPSNIFTDPGVFEVTFSESQGGPVVGTVTITVLAKPDLEIAADPTEGCAPLTVNFEDLSVVPSEITVTNLVWVFGDGETVSNNSTPAHEYDNAGVYTVSLEIETNIESCNVTEIFPDLIDVIDAPQPIFATTPNPASACSAPLTINLTNLTPDAENFEFEWDFGNGETFSGQDPPTQTYTENGSFTITLTAIAPNGCSAAFTRPVTIGNPVVNFEVEDTVCVGSSVIISNLSDVGLYQWNFGAGANPEISTATNPNVNFTVEGTYDINLQVTSLDGQCMSDTTITIYADEVIPTFTAEPNYSCSEPVEFTFTPDSDEAESWEWTFSDGSTSMDEIATYTYVNQDTTTHSINGQILDTVFLLVTNPSGCTGFSFLVDTINLPNALFTPDQVEGCAPLTVEFTDQSTSNEPIVEWTYDFGDGTTSSFPSSAPVTYTYNDPGEYEVELSIVNDAGCTDTSYVVTITVGAPIAPDFEVDQTTVCPGDTVFLEALELPEEVDAWHFDTDNGRSFHCFQESELSYAFVTETGPMDVTLYVEYNGCIDSIVKEDLITVNGPIARIDYGIDCTMPFDVSFADSSFDATAITWEFGDTTTSALSELIHTYPDTGDYTVILTAENPGSGCPPSQDTAIVCVRDIQASFEALPEQVCAGAPVELNASSSQDVDADCWKGYTWFFENNGRPITTQESMIDFAFGNSGPETVSLVVEDVNGCKDTTEQMLTVYQINSNFSLDDDLICFPSTVNFMDLSTADTTIVEWEWMFGSEGNSTMQNPSFEFQGPGGPVVTVTLTVTDAVGCPGTFSQNIDIYTPVSTISTDPFPANICVGSTVDFSATDFTEQGSNLSWEWTLGNGDIATEQTASTTYNDSGVFVVELDYTEVATGCSGTTEQIVNVQSFPEAAFSSDVDNEPILCYPQNVVFTDESVTESDLSYIWDFGNGQLGPDTSVVSASFDKGTFEVEMIVSTSFGCMDTTSQTYTFVGPEGDFSVDSDAICLGGEITFNLFDTIDVSSFTWDFGDGVTVNDQNPVTHTYDVLPSGGSTVATLILRGEDNACVFNVEQPIAVVETVADFLANDGIDTILCVGPFPFTNTSLNADSFSWDFGNGGGSSLENPVANYTETGMYEVTLTATNTALGCTDVFTRTVEVADILAFEVSPTVICPGDTAVLNISPVIENATYVWTPAEFIVNNTVPTPSVFPNTTTTFEVSVTDENGCAGINSTEVVVIEPLDDLTFDTSVVANSTIVLSGPNVDEDLYTFDWSLGPEVMVAEDSVQVTLTITDVQNCNTAIWTYNIAVVVERVALPNIFTPNDDGTNDTFNVLANGGNLLELVNVNDFKVFNRWGQLIYDNDTPMTGWDGTHNGDPAPSEIYVYVIEVEFLVSGRVEQFRGDVTLVR